MKLYFFERNVLEMSEWSHISLKEQIGDVRCCNKIRQLVLVSSTNGNEIIMICLDSSFILSGTHLFSSLQMTDEDVTGIEDYCWENRKKLLDESEGF